MAQNGTGIEFGKSEHVCRRRISRATTISADFIVLGQRCGVQVFGIKVGHMSRRYPLRGLSEIVTDRPSGAKEHRSCAPADAAPRDLRGRKVRCLKFSTSKIRSQKLKPSSRSMFLELQHQVFCSRAPPSWWSRPSRAPARSSTCCHRSAWSVRPRHSCLRPPQPPPSRSRARSSLPTHHAHLEVSEKIAARCGLASQTGRYG